MMTRPSPLRYAPILILSAALLIGAGPAAPVTPPPAAMMSGDLQSRLAIQTAPLAAMTYAPAVSGYARVIDAVPLATLESDLVAALAVAAASRAEADRAGTLSTEDQIVSAKVAEAARAQAVADQTRVTLLRNRLGLEWGAAFAALNEGARRNLVSALARGDAALVRIDGATTPLSGTVTLDLGPNGLSTARVLGAARTADSRLQSSGSLALVTGVAARRLSSGLVVPVRLPFGAGVSGVFVPGSAVLRAEGESWAYIRTAPGRFERRSLGQATAVDNGLFVTSGVQVGETVATRGASALYTAERAGG